MTTSEQTTADVCAALSTMILSASGWRAVFAAGGNEDDDTPEVLPAYRQLVSLAADTFADYVLGLNTDRTPIIVVGRDTRPTGGVLAAETAAALRRRDIVCEDIGVSAAPEIMAYARAKTGFIYLSASHNPIGHNGIKFGLNDGGVIPQAAALPLIAAFREKAVKTLCPAQGDTCPMHADGEHGDGGTKQAALDAYGAFIRVVVSGSTDGAVQEAFFGRLRAGLAQKPVVIAADLNGSARAQSIDAGFFASLGIPFNAINTTAIVHGIIPEGENLRPLAQHIEGFFEAHAPQDDTRPALIGYLCDCDGDRGNIVYYDEVDGEAKTLEAQEGFALSVLSELAALMHDAGCDGSDASVTAVSARVRPAVAVNCPTSMRIDDIAAAFGARVFRAEVGEANVVNLARERRADGYTIRILGEGSNGGNITHPAAVRDPLATVAAILKLLCVDGPFRLWCQRRGIAYNPRFTLRDVLASLPPYATTGVSEARAKLHIATADHAALKTAFQHAFEAYWHEHHADLSAQFGIASYTAIATNGTAETVGISDYAVSGTGGLKIRFHGDDGQPIAFIWMRGSGTEAVFRILADARADACGGSAGAAKTEAALLQLETALLTQADGTKQGVA